MQRMIVVLGCVAMLTCAGACSAKTAGVESAGPAISPPAQPTATVLLIDSTASMASALPAVRPDAQRVLARLSPSDLVAVVVFDRQPVRQTALEPLSADHRHEVGQFIEQTKAEGRSKAPAALEQAFAMLRLHDGTRELYFWTDADAAARQAAATIARLTQQDTAKPVRVHIIITRPASTADFAAQQALTQAAIATGGDLRMMEQNWPRGQETGSR